MTTYSEAAAEAYASQNVEIVTLDTFEMHHPSFVDDNNVRTAIRVVLGYRDETLCLENTAPLNPSEYVLFQKCSFKFGKPGFDENNAATLPISIDGVSRMIAGYLEAAMDSDNPQPIRVYYRPYIKSDPSTPTLDPPYIFTMTDISVNTFTVEATCNLNDVYNWPFPNDKYTRQRFPGLVR